MKYSIICHDGKQFEITEEQKEIIYKLSSSTTKGVDVNGEFIMFSNIARIEKVVGENYTYPNYSNNNMPFERIAEKVHENRKKRAMQSMIKGFKQHFQSREMPTQSKELLSKMELKLKEYEL
ncbi:hypothetical protein M0R04_12915 [Candidatus Dojkabacteria bacterium]|jgi:hypothetical protein|nr:hypothetical protein [Candidatus Dojkabacteria bacterium]